jgi:hypothetical protein
MDLVKDQEREGFAGVFVNIGDVDALVSGQGMIPSVFDKFLVLGDQKPIADDHEIVTASEDVRGSQTWIAAASKTWADDTGRREGQQQDGGIQGISTSLQWLSSSVTHWSMQETVVTTKAGAPRGPWVFPESITVMATVRDLPSPIVSARMAPLKESLQIRSNFVAFCI